MPKSPLIALDTNVLLDLAKENETVLDFFSTVKKRLKNAQVIVLPTVIQELTAIALDDHDPVGAPLAIRALTSITKWGFCPMSYVPVGNGIVEETGRKLRNAGLLPEEEVNDSFIVAEAALADITILISNDHHIREIDQARLKVELDRCDVGCPLIASPWKIVHDYFR